MIIDKNLLESTHREVFKLFVYQFDSRNYGVMEHWTSHAAAVQQGEKFVDDCDGFAFTCCELLLKMGADPSRTKFIVCETETGEGHAVAGYSFDDTTYILENRWPKIYDWKKMPRPRRGYKWQYFLEFENKQWHKITNG